jgi:hypothetical protein
LVLSVQDQVEDKLSLTRQHEANELGDDAVSWTSSGEVGSMLRRGRGDWTNHPEQHLKVLAKVGLGTVPSGHGCDLGHHRGKPAYMDVLQNIEDADPIAHLVYGKGLADQEVL